MGDPVTIELSSHAIERYGQRVRPALAPDRVEEELAHVALAGEIWTEAPDWVAARCANPAPSYLVIADVALPLRPSRTAPGVLVATTCLTRERAPRFRRERPRRAPGFAEAW